MSVICAYRETKLNTSISLFFECCFLEEPGATTYQVSFTPLVIEQSRRHDELWRTDSNCKNLRIFQKKNPTFQSLFYSVF